MPFFGKSMPAEVLDLMLIHEPDFADLTGDYVLEFAWKGRPFDAQRCASGTCSYHHGLRVSSVWCCEAHTV